jgi:hypothetical protein
VQHIVHTYDGTTERLYIDGVERPETVALSGDYSNWDTTDLFSIGNEAGSDRPFHGEVYLVAVYDRALSAAEVRQNFDAGKTASTNPNCPIVDSVSDLVIKDTTISDAQNYDSDAGIIFDNVVMAATANVVAASTFELHLRTGTRIVVGARFDARVKDRDGLSNRCEMKYFGNLKQEPGGDFDGDGLTNLQECQLGLSPCNADSDGDGMPDGWEVQHSLNPAVNDSSADADNDGLTNLEEYQHVTDPNNPDSDGDDMPDGWEVQNGIDPLADDADLDADNDGFSNLTEYQFGSMANDANSRPPLYDCQYDANGNLIQVVEH